MEHKPGEIRMVPSPKLRCVDGITNTLRKLVVKEWWKMAMGREFWRKVPGSRGPNWALVLMISVFFLKQRKFISWCYLTNYLLDLVVIQ